MPALTDHFNEYLPLIEEDLQTLLRPPETYPNTFYHMLQYHMGWVDQDGKPTEVSSGKRIRPVLCLLVADAIDNHAELARPSAAAVELIHNFSLLHDDIQDASPLRRNRPTVWKIWGEAQAINTGDTMFALSQLAVIRLSKTHDATTVKALEVLNDTSLELTRGQYLDMSFEQQETVPTDAYIDMIKGKTAALLGGATRLGALAAGAEDKLQEAYYQFGFNLGLAFQVRDDILDIWGDPQNTGKQAGVDIIQRKKSLPVLFGLQHNMTLRELYADTDEFTSEDVPYVISLLDDVNARGYAEDLARQYTEKTTAALNVAEPKGTAAEALHELVDYLLHRKR